MITLAGRVLAAVYLALAAVFFWSASRLEWALGTHVLSQDFVHPPQQRAVVGQSYIRSRLTGVLVEVRCHKSLLISLQSTMHYFVKHGVRLVVWHASSNEAYIKSLVHTDSFLQKCFRERLLVLHRFEPADFGAMNITKSIERYHGNYWYQQLQKSMDFWNSIPTEWSLTLQSESFICKPLDFLVPYLARNVTYVGGISGYEYTYRMTRTGLKLKQMSRPIRAVPSVHDTTEFFLNGGFTLHSVPWTKECIRSPHKMPLSSALDDLSADEYWNYCRSNLDSTHPVTELEAYSFGSDNGMTMCFDDPTSGERTCPFGVRKPWNTPWTEERGMAHRGNVSELMDHCPGLELLKSTSGQGVFSNETSCDVVGLDGNVTVPCQCGQALGSEISAIELSHYFMAAKIGV